MKRKVTVTMSIGLILSSLTTYATLTPTIERGEKNVYFNSPNGVQEVCVIPKHYANADYKKKDLKKEKELCSYSFYDVTDEEKAAGEETVALLPKLNSTNPGINIYGLPEGITKQQVEAANGRVIDPSTKKQAELEKIGKYKSSTSCSYTPSILGYYHVSRILGGIGRVPVSVLRSMDVRTHKPIAAKGLALTKATDIIHSTWVTVNSILQAGTASSKKDAFLSDDGLQSYGAFITNPKGEDSYNELYTAAAYDQRAAAFRDRNLVFQQLKRTEPIQNIVSSKWSKDNVQKMMVMEDATEFILLDHLMSQQDRFGNIAYQQKVAYVSRDEKNSNELNFELAKDMDDYNQAKQDGLVNENFAPVTVKSMVLKDNDCGVAKANVVKNVGLLAQVAHMNPDTYKKLLAFQKTVQSNESFFRSNLMFTATDFASLVANVNDAVRIVKTNCQAGRLKLDLDVEQYFTTGSVTAASCDGQ